jgi:DNA-binding NtrC family response regulator
LPSQGTHIFVVDDDEIIATTLAKILELSGFTATPFTNPLDALLQSQTEIPDLLLSDVSMPQMSGIELAVQMQQQFPNCKVLLFSGQAATSKMLEDASGQGHDFHLLSKPIHPKDLLREIGKAAGLSSG